MLQKIEGMAWAKGVTVVRCSSSDEALSALAVGGILEKHRALPPSKFRIMSNRSRPEGPLKQKDDAAGMNFALKSRQHG